MPEGIGGPVVFLRLLRMVVPFPGIIVVVTTADERRSAIRFVEFAVDGGSVCFVDAEMEHGSVV